MQQFWALILKRFHHYRRNLRVILTNIFLPCCFVALSMAFTSIRPQMVSQPPLEMSPSIYNPNQQMFMTYAKISLTHKHFKCFITFYFIRIDKTENTYLKSLTSEFVSTFNTVCRNSEVNYYSTSDTNPAGTSSSSLSKQTLNSYLCGLVSNEVSP